MKPFLSLDFFLKKALVSKERCSRRQCAHCFRLYNTVTRFPPSVWGLENSRGQAGRSSAAPGVLAGGVWPWALMQRRGAPGRAGQQEVSRAVWRTHTVPDAHHWHSLPHLFSYLVV